MLCLILLVLLLSRRCWWGLRLQILSLLLRTLLLPVSLRIVHTLRSLLAIAVLRILARISWVLLVGCEGFECVAGDAHSAPLREHLCSHLPVETDMYVWPRSTSHCRRVQPSATAMAATPVRRALPIPFPRCSGLT